jgi:DNA replication initiation complex subunit (GINS family)
MPFVVIFMKYPTHIVKKVVQKALEANQKNLFPDEEDLYEVLVRKT